MTETKDRRTFDRRLHPEITALLINSSWYNLLRYNFLQKPAILKLGKHQLQNLSASGSCISSNKKFKPGDSIHLIIKTPDQKTISVKGFVRWTTAGKDRNMLFVGIQFSAFGRGRRYNSYKIHKQLRSRTFGAAILS